jgi:hypothetical protein
MELLTLTSVSDLLDGLVARSASWFSHPAYRPAGADAERITVRVR